MPEEVHVYGLADEDETAGEGFEPYEEAALALAPEWVEMTDDAIPPGELSDESYAVTVAEAYRAFENDDLMPLSIRYREKDTPDGSPGTVVTYQNSGIETVEDLVGAQIAVEEIPRGTTMAFLTAADRHGYTHDKFDLVEVPEERATSELEDGAVDAAILDSEDWIQEDFHDVFNYNRTLSERYGTVPPTQMWVADRQQYQDNSEPFENFVEWGENVNKWVEERTATRTDLESEEKQKLETHERFGEFKPQDAVALQDISEVARKVS